MYTQGTNGQQGYPGPNFGVPYTYGSPQQQMQDQQYMQNVAKNYSGTVVDFTDGGEIRSKGCCGCFGRQVDPMEFPVQQQYATQNYDSMEFPMGQELVNRNATSYASVAKAFFALGLAGVAYLLTLG